MDKFISVNNIIYLNGLLIKSFNHIIWGMKRNEMIEDEHSSWLGGTHKSITQSHATQHTIGFVGYGNNLAN